MSQARKSNQQTNNTSRSYEIPIYKVALVREAALQTDMPQIRSSKDAVSIIRRFIGDTDREHFIVIMVDRKNKLIGINLVSTGSLSASIVHPREVWKPAILSNAAAVLLAHNHPSGDANPSREDRELTKRLVETGKMLGIPVLDHVTVGDGTDDSFSFADNSMLD